MKQTKKLLLIGSTSGSVHVKNYYHLVKDYFDEVLIVGDQKVGFEESIALNFSLKNPIQLQQSIKKLKGIIHSFNPSVIHVHQANTYAYIAGKANKKLKPIVLTTWGSDVLLLPKQGFLYKYIVKSGLKKADVITADAKFMAEAVQNLGIKKDVTIANFGVDLSNKSIPEKENIIYSNRLHNPLYNINDILDGFAEFVKENPYWKLVIGANGTLTEELKVTAKKILPHDSFEFIGFVNREENIKQYLRAKIWVSIPSSDGTAISLLEAMAYGCIPVVSNLPANKEWVNNKQNGLIVKDLPTALNDALKLDLEKVQNLNKKIVENKATKEVNRAKFYAIYDRLLNITN